MFYFRFQLTVVHQMKHVFRSVLKYQVYMYRALIVIHPIIAAATLHISVDLINTETLMVWEVWSQNYSVSQLSCLERPNPAARDYLLLCDSRHSGRLHLLDHTNYLRYPSDHPTCRFLRNALLYYKVYKERVHHLKVNCKTSKDADNQFVYSGN